MGFMVESGAGAGLMTGADSELAGRRESGAAGGLADRTDFSGGSAMLVAMLFHLEIYLVAGMIADLRLAAMIGEEWRSAAMLGDDWWP